MGQFSNIDGTAKINIQIVNLIYCTDIIVVGMNKYSLKS